MAQIGFRSSVSRGAIAAFALISALCSPAAAGESPGPETVVITARPPDPVGNAAFSTSVLNEQQVQITPQLDQALEQVPGLSLFTRRSSLSTNVFSQAVSLRSIGASGAGRALVTLDGVPQNDPFGNWVVWSSLPSEDIQAAEIVKGAGAGPYGAGALTGVIELIERAGTSGVLDAEAGEIHEARVAGAASEQYGNVSIGASGMYLNSGGWIPILESQRGPADVPLSLKASNAALHGGVDIGGTQVTARVGWYDEIRGTGLVGARSTARGTDGSITIATPEQPDEIGWRVQGWFRDTNMANLTVALLPRRAGTTPAGNQYAVPALGWGVNAAVRGSFDIVDWEVGGDVRLADGQSQELFNFQNGAFRSQRFAGGRTFVGGAYVEGASRIDDWLVTLGARLDEWRNYGGHTVESTIATGAVTLDSSPANASGTLPTARGGLRREFDSDLFHFVRAAAYIGFRPPSLNELFRGFRSGNSYLEANSALKPEKLYGAEVGVGNDRGPLTWEVTPFWNEIHDAVTLVTIANGPGTFPIAGFIPAGGQVTQRQNVGVIRGYGVEGDAQWQIDPRIALRAGWNLTDAHVLGDGQAPQLTGKRPQNTPRWTVTAGAILNPDPLVSLEWYLRYESLRWSDDLNTLPVGPYTTVDVRVSFHVIRNADVYFAVDNAFNALIPVARAADQTISIDEPRLFRAGIRLAY